MEQLEIPSRSYIIRWVDCAPGNTIQWSVKPHKKSLNFGIFRHPGNSASSGASIRPPNTARSEESTTSTIREQQLQQRATPTTTRYNTGDCIDKIHAAGLLDIYWHGKCEAEKVTSGTYQVKTQGGMFALVFDNTFSKQIAKTATFVLLTYPTNAPPPASHALHHADSSNQLGVPLTQTISRQTITSPSAEVLSMHSVDREEPGSQGFQTGILKKRKRKRHQGYARRYFSLDYTSCTLSYYMSKESSALRGAIPLSLAAISASKVNREICIDSGAEVWHLRADNDRDWDTWKLALERAAQHAAKQSTGDMSSLNLQVPGQEQMIDPSPANDQHIIMEERGWAGVEALVGRVSGVRDAVRRLAMQAQEQPQQVPSEVASSAASVMSIPIGDDKSAAGAAKRPFWKRKASAQTPSPGNMPTSPRPGSSRTINTVNTPATPGAQQDISFNLQALLSDLDSVVSDFSSLISQNKQRRWATNRTSIYRSNRSNRTSTFGSGKNAASSRMSMESTASEEFFDAEDALEGDRVVMLDHDDDEGVREEAAEEENEATDNEESDEEDSPTAPPRPSSQPTEPVVTNGIKDLSPLPLELVQRRNTVPEAKVLPPSLIGFLRKNVGKDLSTIAMPVSANEPISLLQRMSEQLEYSELLDAAASAPAETGERILLVAAFAISSFSGARIKERAIRKPFNPMLGETFELVREDKGFRFLSEKVSHRPVIMACHADHALWSFSQSPQPTQKFWGKSAELITSGRVRINFHQTGDKFSYTVATSFLRNIIAGEKYVEPTGTMHIHNETTGEKAVVTFKMNKGMFSGRSEEVSVQAFDAEGGAYNLILMGKWTENLMLVDDTTSEQREIWRVADLVDGAPQRYGWTEFAAQLNQITEIEAGNIAPTDSRNRPDQRMVEEGRLDEAEGIKLKLEEKQRDRRREMEEEGKVWEPVWFRKVREYADEEVWRIVGDEEEGYWKKRQEKDWNNTTGVFEV
ncbi:Similar to Oxysterol-binding protein homolog C23H4.01c; acc. no. O13944 [Pyronema omphalodes CBS 100304]|uniref:Similar to Oxysterol-binding protein homolog C23H4.01c acc. no. O13944 n=1 Tax=Pyronema omphalodes (strain CBS 100304) TaxID=1076935 RepID=U4L9S0_PYROM|nr:Similar to Oxysterol-binding protein homolog C23H4.01c; acc. no. O13944 [Pyronema omphalodes CBS 100304]